MANLTKLGEYSRQKLIEYLNKEKLDVLHKMKLEADDLYYNTDQDSGLKDWQYDLLKETLATRDPGYKVPIGARIREHANRSKLPFWLGSMEKIKPDDDAQLSSWVTSNPSQEYIIEDKLDGVSCLVIYDKGKIKLFTRGDGQVGADISYLAQYFSTLPKLDKTRSIAVRGELIMPRAIFDKKYNEKYHGKTKDTYKTARGMVAGRVGGKKIRSGLDEIDFIAYELVADGTCPKPSEQLDFLESLGFLTVRHKIVDEIDVDTLGELFFSFRNDTKYEIDGLIVQANQPYVRNTTDNPDYAFAFKMILDENVVNVLVTGVDWNVSKWGRLKPRVEYEPTDIGGYTNNWATGHNAKYIYDNSIGPGAIIRLTRSGDTIPYIMDVFKPADAPDMPEIPYEWNETGVDIYTDADEGTMCIKLIAGFFSALGIKHVGQQTVQKMYAAGMDTLLKIISADKSDFLELDGFQEKLAERTHTSIHDGLKNVDMSKVLGSSGIFGFGVGSRKIQALLTGFPDILTEYKKLERHKLLDRILAIEGFSDKTAVKIADNIEWADMFVTELKKYATFKEKVRINSSLKNQVIVFSGTRPEQYPGLRDDIEGRGGKITGSVSGKTTILIVKSKGQKLTGKMQTAQDNGAEILSVEEFMDKYIN